MSRCEASAGPEVWIGTSGYSYPEWVEAGFYPPRTRAAQMLPCYASRFCTTELNHTWYQMPRAAQLERQRLVTPSSFLFAAKVVRTLTHEVEPGKWREQAEAFSRGIAPLQAGRQLAALLVQLPHRFHRSLANRSHLAALLDALANLPLAVEFRSASWANDRVFAELERRKVTLVTVDVPPLPGLFPGTDVVTNPERVYVRFHGRNAQGWYSGSKQRQFDYRYREEELEEWAETRFERMARLTRRVFVFFNNHVAAQAPRDAAALARLLGRRGHQVVHSLP